VGHVGVQMSKALRAHTTVFELSSAKRDDALRLGADAYHLTTTPGLFDELANSLDLIVSTVPVNVDIDAYLGLLRRDGTYVSLGVPSKPLSINAMALLRNRRSIAGSLSGGLPQTQEMLDFCGAHGIGAEVEVVDADRIDEAYRRLLDGDVRYRFVIDIRSMTNQS